MHSQICTLVTIPITWLDLDVTVGNKVTTEKHKYVNSFIQGQLLFLYLKIYDDDLMMLWTERMQFMKHARLVK
jgi:hypothetical protein